MKRLALGSNKLWQPTTGSRLCSNHFVPQDFWQGKHHRFVRVGAVPSVFSFSILQATRKSPAKKAKLDMPLPTAENNLVNATSLDHSYALPSKCILKKRHQVQHSVIFKKAKQIHKLQQTILRLQSKLKLT